MIERSVRHTPPVLDFDGAKVRGGEYCGDEARDKTIYDQRSLHIGAACKKDGE